MTGEAMSDTSTEDKIQSALTSFTPSGGGGSNMAKWQNRERKE